MIKESDNRNTSFDGDKGEQLYRYSEGIPYNIDSMYPSIISESLKSAGQSQKLPSCFHPPKTNLGEISKEVLDRGNDAVQKSKDINNGRALRMR